MILTLINNFKIFINIFTSRFTNLKNLFTLRSLFILIITLLISFSVRWLLVLYFNYDLYVFKDFCITGLLVSFILSVQNYFSEFEFFKPLLCDGPDIGRAKRSGNGATGPSSGNTYSRTVYNPNDNRSSGNTYLRAVAYNPNDNRSAVASRYSGVSSTSNPSNVSRATTTYSVPIMYAPSITRDSISYSRPTSDLHRISGVVQRPTNDMVSTVLPSRPRHIPSIIPSPQPSGNLSLFPDSTSIATQYIAPTSSGYNPPRITKPTNLTSPSTITTQYTTPSRSPYNPPSITKPSNLTTPDTMSPLFPASIHSHNVGNTVSSSPNVNLNTRDGFKCDSVVNKHISSENASTINTTKEFSNRRHKIIEAVTTEINELNRGYSSKEVVIARKGLFGKIRLGFESFGSDIKSIYVKYDGITRRKLLWTLWEGGTEKYNSYEEFKNSWDPNTKVWKKIRTEIKMSLKQEVENFLDHMRPFDGVLDSSNRTKYMNHRNTTNKNIGLSNSNDRNKIINTSKGLQNVHHMKVRQESSNTVTNNFSSANNNVKAHLNDNGKKIHTSERHYTSERQHRHHRSHRGDRITRTSRR